MVNFEWFIRRMKSIFQTEVLFDDVSYETYDFYHDELDELLVPAEHLEKLPNPLTLRTFSYIDKHGYEWIAGAVEEEGTNRLLYEVWIRNGETIAYEIYVE
jgi:hypothetical protein